ncbi:uncharacterized protein [Diadema antillarum]|uniref:uncharacterized protein n=1 Tax=Diadema antillarum TaxID=105358 RepID=UPI003A88FC24
MVDSALTTEGRKMFIMGRISAVMQCGKMTVSSKRLEQKERQRARVLYSVEGFRVCRPTFMFMHSIGDTQLRSITKSYLAKGAVPPSKASGGINKLALSIEDIQRIIAYIVNYGEQQGMVIPGRVSGVNSTDPRIRLLPCNITKSSVWRSYKKAISDQNAERVSAGLGGFRIASYRSFLNLWDQYCPFVMTTRPQSDLCWQCQQNSAAVYNSANLDEDTKLSRLRKQQDHLAHVAAERNLYREMVGNAQNAVNQKPAGEAPAAPEVMHYSFDYAQQMHFPSDPMQPGPIYFLCPRKCALFGIVCDGTNEQVNYLIDEGMQSCKGSNSVISYLHDFFRNYGMGERTAHLHCDNCGGQNKNRFVMWYLAWRTLCGLHHEISINFMVPGHTKFSPDRGFGLIKHRYKRQLVSSLQDLSDMVSDSSVSGYNIPRLVGMEDGSVIVPTYDWQTFLSPYFSALPGIKQFHHVRFNADHPGVAFVKVYPSDNEKAIQLLRSVSHVPPAELPEPIPPPGLTRARMEYLYKSIREFCTASTRDTVCPAPPQSSKASVDEDLTEE